MRLPLNKRLLSLLTLLVFAAGISYHHLCEAQFLKCSPCQTESGDVGDEEDAPCKSCEQSAELSSSAQLSKQTDIPLAYAYLAARIIEQIVFTPPEHIVQDAAPPPTELPLAFILRDLKQSIPIRGPSITA